MNKFCHHLVVDVFLSSVTIYSLVIKSYKDGEEYKTNLGYDLYRLIHHSFSSLLKIWDAF